MNQENIHNNIISLVNAWCEQRKLEPLRYLLNGRASINGLTDGWQNLLHSLKTIRAQLHGQLTEDELNTILELIHEVESGLYE